MRCAMTRVLPLPAPATTSTGPLVAVTASRCEGLRERRMLSAVTSERSMRPYDTTETMRPVLRLLHRHRLREIAWLIHVATEPDGHVVREQLKRNHHQDRREEVRRWRHFDER